MRKKKIKSLVLICTLVMITTGCGTITECDICDKKTLCKPAILFSEEINVCKSCAADINRELSSDPYWSNWGDPFVIK
jgi:hypothetical protein